MKKTKDFWAQESLLQSRRDMIRNTAALTAVMSTGLLGLGAGELLATAKKARSSADRRRRIHQVLVSWPYMAFGGKWNLDQLCQAAVDLGCKGIELVGPDAWKTMRKYGLECVLSVNGMPDPPYEKGLNNPRYQPQVIETTRRRIQECASAGVPSVIAFTGYRYRNNDRPQDGEISPEEGADHTVKGLEELAQDAEHHGVTICLEHLNSRVADDDFRGHPAYQGDDIDYCADIVRRVGSPRVKLLFDIYHVQIMNGDIIARIREYGVDLIGHIHTAGVPGRVEMDHAQELNYPAIMEALLEIGYEGYVGHEFIPTRNPMDGLRQAIALCDV